MAPPGVAAGRGAGCARVRAVGHARRHLYDHRRDWPAHHPRYRLSHHYRGRAGRGVGRRHAGALTVLLNTRGEATGMIYEIRVKGHLAPDWSDWFEQLALRHYANGEPVIT